MENIESFAGLMCGVMFCLTGIIFYISTKSLRNNGVITKAKVIGNKVVKDIDGNLIKTNFQFQDKSGKTQIAKSLFSTSFANYSKGDEVVIIYDSENPQKVLPNNQFLLNIYLLPLLIGAIILCLHFMSKQ